MKSNTKITLIIFSMVLLLTSIIVVLVAIGSRQVGYDAVKKKAYLTADIVKNSLTSHMVNGNMDQRDVFLDSIAQLKEVNDLWIIRIKKDNTIIKEYKGTDFITVYNKIKGEPI